MLLMGSLVISCTKEAWNVIKPIARLFIFSAPESDLNHDGDLDILATAWDKGSHFYILRNDAVKH